jgi:hypothetical protein
MPMCQLGSWAVLCHPRRRDGGYREQDLPLDGPGKDEEVIRWLLRYRGTFGVCSASLLGWCGYIPMLSTSLLRYGEGELRYSIYTSPWGWKVGQVWG